MTSILLDDLGRLAAARGDYETAFACSQEALSICEKYGNRWGSSYDLQFMAFIAYDQKEYSRSRALFQKAIPLAYEFQDRRHLFYLFIGIAMVALAQGQLERAARMMGVSEILAHTIGFAFTSDEQELLAALRQQLGEERFEVFTAEGRGMTIEQAVLYALGKNNE